jgi:hypothetical protein
MPSNLRTRQQRFRGSKRHLQPHKSVCQAALSRCGLLQRCLRGIRAKNAKRAPLRYTGVARQGNKFGARIPKRLHLGEKYLGVFDTQDQAARAIAAVVGSAAGGGLHLKVQPVEDSGFRGVTMRSNAVHGKMWMSNIHVNETKLALGSWNGRSRPMEDHAFGPQLPAQESAHGEC